MRIAWFTPFSKQSAIGKFSQLVTNELSKTISVDLWLCEKQDLIKTDLPIHYYDSISQKTVAFLKKYDIVVYNIGNFFDYHKSMFEVSRNVKGIVILHDYVLHHFFAAYYLTYKKNKDIYIFLMKSLYGKKGEDVAKKSVEGIIRPIWETENVFSFPLFENALLGALGAINFTPYLTRKVQKKFSGPVTTIPLPYYPQDSSVFKKTVSKTDLGILENQILLLTIGHVIPNKRIHKTIEALAELPELHKNIRYVIVGPHVDINYSSQLTSLIQRYHLDRIIQCTGYQPDHVLYQYLTNADIFINLKYPVMGGFSWSTVEELYFGKPVIVNNTSFYTEFPNDCIIKIRPTSEKDDLKKTLKKLIQDKNLRESIGKKGRMFAIKHFRTDVYAKKFLLFAKKVLAVKPKLEMIDKNEF